MDLNKSATDLKKAGVEDDVARQTILSRADRPKDAREQRGARALGEARHAGAVAVPAFEVIMMGAEVVAGGAALGVTAQAAGGLAKAAAYGFHLSQDVYRSVRLPLLVRGVSAEVNAAIASGSRDTLIELGAGSGEATQALAGGRTAAAARGSIIDTAMKDQASTTFGLRGLHYTKRFEYGPDISNPVTGRAWDITTPGQWDLHVEQYVTNPPPGRPSYTSLDPLFTK